MYVTTRFAGVEKGGVNYLFLLLTEDYIRTQLESLNSLLELFSEKLGKSAALVKTYDGKESVALGDVLKKDWDDEFKMNMRYSLPALLAINENFDEFNPLLHPYIFISLRDSMDDYGRVRIFEVKELLDELTTASKIDLLFEMATEYLESKRTEKINSKILDKAWESFEAKPGVFGFNFDIKKALELLKQIFDKTKIIYDDKN